MKNAYDIIYEDDEMVVVSKAPFILTIPDRFHPDKPNLYQLLGERFGKIFTVHRLDKETSGILVFAKTEETHKLLSAQFTDRTVEKVYYALVEGHVHQTEGMIDKSIAPHPQHPDRMVISTKGKRSVTRYSVVEYFKNYTLLQASIETGRTHQIRVHFQAIGYPLAVDALYGRKDAFLLSQVKMGKYRLGKDQEERPLMARSSLHAWRLNFVHPGTGERLTFEAPLPKDFEAVLQQLRKFGK
jgi:RluA family pseudouridine synthase